MATPLEELGPSLCYRVDDSLDVPEPRLGQAQRTRVRTVSGMQKEALVTSSLSGQTWRLASDEGPYLDGADVAPPPLGFLAAGMVSSYTSELLGAADRRGVVLDDVEVVLDNYYAISGSLLRGTMTGSAFPPDLSVRAEAADADTLATVVDEAVAGAPVTGLLRDAHDSRFRLVHNGTQLTPEGVGALDGDPGPDPASAFEALPRPGGETDTELVRHTGRTTEPHEAADDKYTGSDAAGYAEEQDRKLHLRATCTLGDDGVKHVEQELFSPRGSVFEFRSDEPTGHGGEGRAPDAMSYVAAGLGFCFMTQLGRYAHAMQEELTGYRLVQDTHVSTSRSREGSDESAEARPVETDLFLDTSADADFATTALQMSEQTCYLHALCRTAGLEPDIEVSTS